VPRLQPFSDPPASTLGCRLFSSPVSERVYAHCSSLQALASNRGSPELSQSTQSLRGLRLTSLDPPGSGNCLENPRISSSILLSTVVSHQLPHHPPLAIAIVLLLDTRREPPPQTTGHCEESWNIDTAKHEFTSAGHRLVQVRAVIFLGLSSVH
jgi:hypothetical protein